MPRLVMVLCLLAGASGACAAVDAKCGSGSPRSRRPVAISVVRWEPPLEVAKGRAHAGPWRMNESNFDYVDDATVALAANGDMAVAWADNTRKDVFLQMYAADGSRELPVATNVSNSPQIFSWLPRLVIHDNQVWVLWQEVVFSGGSHGGEIFFARSENRGASFSAPLNISRSVGGDGKGRLTRQIWDNGSLDIVRDAAGVLLIAWTEYDGALWFSSSSDDGRSFAAPLRVGGSDEAPARAPSLAGTVAQELYLVWASGETAKSLLLLAISRDGGKTFDAPRAVVRSDGHVDAPKIARDSRGVVHLAYGERPNDIAPSRIRYLRLRNAAQDVEEPRTLSRQAGGLGASFPSLSLASPGQIAVAWLHHASASAPPLGLELSVSSDDGGSFSPPQLVPETGDAALGVVGSRQGKLMRLLSANASGTLAVANSTFREGASSRIRVVRGHLR